MSMTRLTITMAAWLVLVSVGFASFTPRGGLSGSDRDVPRAQAAQGGNQSATEEPEPEFVVTSATKVFLNGEPCKYADIPEHATIVSMKVAADRKTVLEVYFRTRK
jgi:hypothetical protein